MLADVPSSLTTAYSLPNQPVPGQYRAISAHGLSISHDGDVLTATNADGSTAWTYTRSDADLCSLSTAWGKVVATYRTGVGCGDTVAINAATGEYDSTRSAINSPDVVPVQSNDRVGTVSAGRIDLWRSDLVRTVEYGEVEAKQEAQKQPHEECTISSALTRTENLALTESCPEELHTTWLRFQNTTPEDSGNQKWMPMSPSIAMERGLSRWAKTPPRSISPAQNPALSPITTRAKSFLLPP